MPAAAPPATDAEPDPGFVHAFRTGALTPEQARAFAAQDRAVIAFQLLALAGLVALKTLPHTPSGSLAPFDTALPKGRRRKKPGGQTGHPGHARDKPERIDRRVDHELPQCPDCGGELTRTGRTRTRVVEDIPADLKAEATEHTIHRDWCPGCKKQVEPVVPDAMPACTLGDRAVTLSAYLHYAVGTTTGQIVDVFNAHLQLPISPGGLTQMWHRLADTLQPWYDQIGADGKNAAVLHADETGWHRNGALVWLWCFCTGRETFYTIEESRGRDVLSKHFTEAFEGVLVTDFYRAYNAVNARMNQKCWAHLLRELKAVEDRPNGPRDDGLAFARPLKRIYTDAVRLAVRGDDVSQSERDLKVCRLHARMTELACGAWRHPDARRLAKRLRSDGVALLTFAEFPGVPGTNNQAEREVRPAVLMRKASFGSGSPRGAATRAVLMTVFRTLRKRGLDPLAETRRALRTLAETGTLPPLPGGTCSGG